MKKVLIAVDLQKDFVDGSLGTEDAVAIVPRAVQEIEDPSYDLVIATLDTHTKRYLSTLEGKYLPVEHCVKGTSGWMLEPRIEKALQQRHASYIEKPTFGSEILMKQMQELQPDEIVLIGLCTDICVVSNALMLRAALPNTTICVIADACAGVTKEKHEAALKVLASCQIEIQ
jgi:nicotinamidase-related amidase